MTSTTCPSEERVFRYVDRDLSPEDAAAIDEHLAACVRCRSQVGELNELVAHVRSSAPPSLDVPAHVRAVMKGVNADTLAAIGPPPMAAGATRRRWLLALAGSVAAAAALVLWIHEPAGRFQARGSNRAATSARDVGVQVYAVGASPGALRDPQLSRRGGAMTDRATENADVAHQNPRDAENTDANGPNKKTARVSLIPLVPGATIRPNTPLTAGYRNLGSRPVYLLLFAVDAANSVHWITPSYLQAERDPLATALAPSTAEQLLPQTVVFDDLAEGPLRFITLITPAAARVSAIESLGRALDNASIAQHLPQAELREQRLFVSNQPGVLP